MPRVMRTPGRDSSRVAVRLLVHDVALGGEVVFRPLLLVVNERALRFAEDHMLQRGDRQWPFQLLIVHWKVFIERG